MSRYEAFCNTTTDLQAICDIDSYDRKRVLPNNAWVASSTSNLYFLHNSGFCSVLYRNGKDLGAAQSSEPSSNQTWRYVAADDRLEYFETSSSVTALEALNFEESQDFSTLKTQVVNESADLIRSYINRPIYRRKNADLQGASSREYDFILVRINALLAASDLVRRYDEEKADEIYSRAISVDGDGLLDRLKRGDFALWHETTNRSEDGIVQVVSIDSSTTGYPSDIKMHGLPNVDYDEIRLVISTGGNFQPKSASTVKYDVLVKDDTGLGMSKVVDAETITGSYQTCAYGSQVIWQPGLYVTGDEFSVTFQSSDVAVGSVKSGQMYR